MVESETPTLGATTPRGPVAKGRIMDVADRLFYRDGIHATGIDRLISEAPTTKATFYKHFGSKDAVILAYVNGRAARAAESYQDAISNEVDGIGQVHALVGLVCAEISQPAYRGSAMSNAAVEFPKASHPVRVAVSAHRDWVTDFMYDVFERAGSKHPGDDADQFLLAVDGAQCGSYAGDAIASRTAFVRTVAAIVDSLGAPHR
jgi:AcrR family transcriptional regulator